VDPDAATVDAIERLRFAQENFPDAAADLEEIVVRLERSRDGIGGDSLVVDSCHLQAPPRGLNAWIEARQAVLHIELLLEQAARNNPRLPLAPALASILVEVQENVLGVYRFLADVALQEARAFAADGSGEAQIEIAERQLEQAGEEIAAGELDKAMQSLRQVWEHAQQVIPASSGGPENTRLSIQEPLEGAVLFATPIDVSGMVQMLTPGTVGADNVTVSVNGLPAEVVHRSFVARDVPLVEGVNALVGVARSTGGGVAVSCVAVSLDTTPRPRITAVSGVGQTAEIRTELPQPLGVQVLDATGSPVVGVPVVFRVTTGDGSLDDGLRSAVLTSDGLGRAEIDFTLGSRAGVAVNRVRVTAVGFPGEVIFSPTSTAIAAASINPVSGDNQRGAVGAPLAEPLVVVVTDAGQNPVEGAPIVFEVLAGDGSIEGASQATVATDPDGRAAAEWTLGPEAGLDGNLVEARFAGLVNEPATFKASGFVTGDPTDTSLGGVVFDNQGDPVPGVTLRIAGTSVSTTADVEGQFLLEGVPAGEIILEVDASTTTRSGVWANLAFDLHTLPGVLNTMEKPIFILPLDVGNGRIVGGPEDVTVTVPEVPGFSLTVLAGSATFPDGSHTGLVSVTPVHADKIPMAPGSGMQPRFIVTVQPAGAHFDPPAPVTFPNVDGLPAGAVTEMFSFDHDLGEFVSIGTGTVSEDGTVVASDPGFGIVKAGWHCSAPQSGSGASATVNVDITTEGPVILQEGDQKLIAASGGPPRDAEYSWRIGSSSIASLDPSGSGLCPDSTSCNTTATGGSSFGRTTATVTIVCTTTGATDSDEIEVVVPEVEIEAEAIDQDDPDNTSFDVQDPEVVYGGSIPKTADNLKLKAKIEPMDLEVARYIWSVSGPGSGSYTPPAPSPDADEWDVGDIEPTTGKLQFMLEVEFSPGGSAEGEREQEVGVRTDDMVVIGWIDPAGVPLSGAGMGPDMLRYYPLTGSASMGTVQKGLTLLHLGLIAAGSTIHPVQIRSMTSAEKTHVLNWQFKFAANFCSKGRCPPTTFADEAAVTSFRTGKQTSYKLFNRFQIKYRSEDGVNFTGTPTVLRQATAIGVTNDPIFDLEEAGEAGPNEGRQDTLADRAYLINDGTPTSIAVSGFNTLADPLKWSHIGSRIELSVQNGTEGEVFVQVYPTYYVFKNLMLINTIPQAPNPIGNFSTTPYPPGPAPFIP